MISFTGSSAVGARIAEAGGRTMKRLLLELGGKGAAIVLDDADLDLALSGIMATYTFMSGQGCVLPTRAVVHRSVYEEVVAGLAGRAAAVAVGDPLDPTTVVGPVISDAQRSHIERLVATATDEGASVVVGGTRPDLPRGYYVTPTLVRDVEPHMTLAQNEAFGPVVCVIPFETDDEAIAITNGTDFGLNNYVFSADTGRAYRMAGRLRSGTVCINTTQPHPEGPFGGFKRSGVGRDGGSFGLDAYSELQSVVWV
jgi:acyl-CoA reductase-like NAD-dependent aldehyde dehydrogenase